MRAASSLVAIVGLAACADDSGLDTMRRERDAYRNERAYFCEEAMWRLHAALRPYRGLPSDSPKVAQDHARIKDAVASAYFPAHRCTEMIPSSIDDAYRDDLPDGDPAITLDIGFRLLEALRTAREARWPLMDDIMKEYRLDDREK
jgi:hypothetical protein